MLCLILLCEIIPACGNAADRGGAAEAETNPLPDTSDRSVPPPSAAALHLPSALSQAGPVLESAVTL